MITVIARWIAFFDCVSGQGFGSGVSGERPYEIGHLSRFWGRCGWIGAEENKKEVKE
jgi:hypothetical protein